MNLTIGRKLFVSAALGAGLTLAVGAAGYIGTVRLGLATDALTENLKALRAHQNADTMHDALRADVLGAMLAGQQLDETSRAKAEKDTQAHSREMRDAVEAANRANVADEIRQRLGALKPNIERYVALANELAGMAYERNIVAVGRYPDFLQVFETLDKEIRDISGLIERHTEATQEAANAARSLARLAIVLVCALAVLVLLGVSYRIAMSIVRPLGTAVHVADRIASGNLDNRIDARGRDEVARLLDSLGKMNESLVAIVSEVRDGATAVAAAAGEIARGNTDLSGRIEEQASSLEQTASSMEEITSTVKQTAENARLANQLAASALDTAGRGGQVVGKVVTTMGGISDASTRIADIIGVIDGIAFQTNILALNAAVEAARAGEQGRGFAVVASEVRALAQRSAAAAKEIRGLIQNSVDRVGEGTQLVEAAGKTMQEIVVSVRRVTDVISEIAAASAEQLSGIEQVSHAVTQMDQVVQQNAALVEQSAAAAENQSAQSDALVRVVAKFNLGDERAGVTSASAQAPAIEARAKRIERRSPGTRSQAALPQAADASKRARRIRPADGTDGGDWKEF